MVSRVTTLLHSPAISPNHPKIYFLGCFGEIGGEWICLGVVDLLGIISFFLLSLVVRKLVVGYLKDTNAGE